MEPSSKRDMSAYYVPAAIVIAGVIIGGSVYAALKSGGASGGGGGGQATVDIKDVAIEGSPFIGKEDAPVIIATWADYQCPFCKAVEVGGVEGINITPALPVIIKEYVDTGKARIVFKDFAFLSEDSTTAALYGRAVWDLYPSKYYEWRDEVYKAQDEEHGGFGDEPSILALSRKMSGIDADKLKAQVQKNRDAYLAAIEADKAEAGRFGIQGTPAFIIGTTLIPGAVDVAQFKAAIDAQL